jgi:hypothetical protein
MSGHMSGAKQGANSTDATRRSLTPEAERALAEAAAWRAAREREKSDAAKEVSGRGGLDPTRYGDWEINGLTPDF